MRGKFDWKIKKIITKKSGKVEETKLYYFVSTLENLKALNRDIILKYLFIFILIFHNFLVKIVLF